MKVMLKKQPMHKVLIEVAADLFMVAVGIGIAYSIKSWIDF